ncbi:TetR/AcrR family transcriptional regulator [Streptomyces glomeratus]|uniref:HTH tetR-type domain-containing protein n=1 Tax=Streptomyces glomeratus TaxID=284452 RepID=A0ABP6M2Z4_9ACTN|nr:TetR/AcrR family transcriptional regulator [Streptomyces glomeratus]MCF1512383.1 TetR/AcrR family transcriptional regulator [Streptomyces glomeratus]
MEWNVIAGRAEQRRVTRARITEAAVESLIESGVAATTTLQVQRRAGVSRGALLHHFPTHEELLGAAITRLVEHNEEVVRKEMTSVAQARDGDRWGRSLRVFGAVLRSLSYAAELELWAVARTDPRLRETLRRAEGAARRDHRVLGDVLGPEATAAPGCSPAPPSTCSRGARSS